MKENEDRDIRREPLYRGGLEQKSRENIVNFYRDELLQILDGVSPMEVLSDSVRSRLREYGVLNKTSRGAPGSTYSVSPLGKKMLGWKRNE